MKQTEANRLAKIIEGLQAIHKLIGENKLARATKSIESLVSKLEKKVSGASSTKKAPSAWNKFYSSNYKRIASQNPDLETKEIMKLIAKMWKESDKGATLSSSPAKKEKKAKTPTKTVPKPKKSPKPRKPRTSKA